MRSVRARTASSGSAQRSGLGIEVLLDRVGAPGQVHAIEVSSAMLNRAARRFRREIANGRLSLHAASFTDLPLADASLDGAITLNTLYFVADLDRAFSELARPLKASGQAVIGLGDPEWMHAANHCSGVPASAGVGGRRRCCRRRAFR